MKAAGIVGVSRVELPACVGLILLRTCRRTDNAAVNQRFTHGTYELDVLDPSLRGVVEVLPRRQLSVDRIPYAWDMSRLRSTEFGASKDITCKERWAATITRTKGCNSVRVLKCGIGSYRRQNDIW